MKEIELSNIESFSKIYNSNVDNKNIEKANSTYEKIIRSKTADLDKIVKRNILKNPVEEVGNWKTFVGIVKKYGLVPMEVMPTTFEGENASRVTNLFSETVRSNSITLLKFKSQNKNLEELIKIKLKNYHIKIIL